MNTLRPWTARVAALAVLALVTAGPFLASRREVAAVGEVEKPSFRYSLFFGEAAGLKPGHPVTFHGVAIGDVLGVELTDDNRVRVTVRLDEAHKHRVRADSTARIVQESLVSVTGERAVEVVNGDAATPPLAAGAEIAGVDSWAALQLWSARREGGRLATTVGNQATGLLSWMRERCATPTEAK